MNTKHTQGPWKDGPVFNKEGRAIFFSNDSKPGKWQQRLDDKSGIFSEADARLIAAAPDLLAAVTLFQRFFDEMPKGQFGKICCDVGLMNDAFIASGRALAKVKSA